MDENNKIAAQRELLVSIDEYLVKLKDGLF